MTSSNDNAPLILNVDTLTARTLGIEPGEHWSAEKLFAIARAQGYRPRVGHFNSEDGKLTINLVKETV